MDNQHSKLFKFPSILIFEYNESTKLKFLCWEEKISILNFLTNLILINKILINKGQIKNNFIVETYISMLGREDIGQVSAIMQ